MAKYAYTAYGHPKGITAVPWFEIRGNQLYTAYGHPKGITAVPWFEIR